MKIKVGVSTRHIHLTEEDYKILFNDQIEIINPINQPGQYKSNKTVTLEANGKTIENVRLIGPFRPYTQVEISKTEAIFFKISPPVRSSGDLEGAASITIIGEKGKITRNACIIANRHIHVSTEMRKELNLNNDEYTVKVSGEKGGTLEHVKISESKEAYFEMHIDTDDANAFNLEQNSEVEIIN